MTRLHLLIALGAAVFLSGCYYDSPPYPGATYKKYGTGYNTRYGYDDPWEVGYTEPRRTVYGFNNVGWGWGGGYGGYGRRHYYDHDDYCDDHDRHHKKSSSSSHKKSSSSSHKKSSSGSRSKSSSSSSRAKEWQKDKGGNPRAKRGS